MRLPDLLGQIFRGGDLPMLMKHIDSRAQHPVLFKTLANLRAASPQMRKFVDNECLELLFKAFRLGSQNRIYVFLNAMLGLTPLHANFLLSSKHPYCSVNPLDYVLLRRIVGNAKLTACLDSKISNLQFIEQFANDYVPKNVIQQLCRIDYFRHETLGEHLRKGNVDCSVLLEYWKMFLVTVGTSLPRIAANTSTGGIGNHMYCTHCCTWTTESKTLHNCVGQKFPSESRINLSTQMNLKKIRLLRELRNIEKTQEFVRMCRGDMDQLQTMDNQHVSLISEFDSARKYERYANAEKAAKTLKKLLPQKRAIEQKYWLKRKRGE